MNMEIIRAPSPEPRTLSIYPVILAVPDNLQQLTGREKVSFLSRYARKALGMSALKSRIRLGDLNKNQNGVPLPFDGTYWSVTHKTGYVGGVVARERIGIDLEKIRPIKGPVYRKTANHSEWALSNIKSLPLFFRYWTSKESVLKAAGSGIRDLLKCRIKQIIDDKHLIVDYEEKDWLIEHFYFNEHIASVVKNEADIHWTLLKSSDQPQ